MCPKKEKTPAFFGVLGKTALVSCKTYEISALGLAQVDFSHIQV
jgi:hypothetical protein